MLVMMADDRKPYFAHPMFRAPFVVVGEGGANVQQTQHAGYPFYGSGA